MTVTFSTRPIDHSCNCFASSIRFILPSVMQDNTLLRGFHTSSLLVDKKSQSRIRWLCRFRSLDASSRARFSSLKVHRLRSHTSTVHGCQLASQSIDPILIKSPSPPADASLEAMFTGLPAQPSFWRSDLSPARLRPSFRTKTVF